MQCSRAGDIVSTSLHEDRIQKPLTYLMDELTVGLGDQHLDGGCLSLKMPGGCAVKIEDEVSRKLLARMETWCALTNGENCTAAIPIIVPHKVWLRLA